ncbi:ZYRO0C16720p [Zygosaccharomyces rouxii]|uniref:ZYRO0C16720p n=1 Tax=Zygosaccharomyces rouxii (strain ATCC 2623 / CBS 732 / NBRC 1130 / NCYC 568 / NRRL Y-229) TaxID=559307 RepID=C5DUH1_ZYGRC|nr:uncharacterized protein ZYRO0C16720g [Zygosaccharomyces rouxii]KAH9201398.1 hypothetical protein LQ764DRAFT_78644 [Zygosaccharomyces rouxii]CAR27432.1 ZYRO0C16720p [Zygosaccharomyces rouxii]
MNQLACTCEDDDDDFMFEHDNTSHCLDLELQRLNEESVQMGLLVNNIEERTKEDIVRWQKVLEDSRFEGKATFLQRISHMVSPGSGSSPVGSIDERTVSAQLKKTMERDLQLTQGSQRQHKYRKWRTWFKEWVHRNGGNEEKKENPEKWTTTDSDSEGLLVMNSVIVGGNQNLRQPHRVHSTVQARNFSDHARLPSSSVTLAEHKYLFGGNNTASLTTGIRATHHSSSNESIISESTSGLQIAHNLKYSALTHGPTVPAPTPALAPVTAHYQDNVKGPRSSCEISTPPLLQSQSKKSKSTSSMLGFRGRSFRSLRGSGHSLRKHHL